MKIPSTLALLTLLLAVVPALANDSYFAGVSGSPTPAQSQSEHRAIRMESEKVMLTLRPNQLFETDANFVFVNDSGQSVTVQMGSPETNVSGGAPLSDSFYRFKTLE